MGPFLQPFTEVLNQGVNQDPAGCAVIAIRHLAPSISDGKSSLACLDYNSGGGRKQLAGADNARTAPAMMFAHGECTSPRR